MRSPSTCSWFPTRGGEPDRAGRGWSAHATTQNALAEWLRAHRLDPRSPAPDEPDYDLLTDDGETVWVFEIKSLTPENEERQLRTATGQVLRYRQKLGALSRPVRAVIIAEHEPADPEWEALLDEQDIVLAWPGAFGRLPLERALPAPG